MTEKDLCEFIRKYFIPSPIDGNFILKVKKGSRRHCQVGEKVGYPTSCGHRRILINYVEYQEHRLVWLYHFGCFPPGMLDHKNGKKTDNRITNLRKCTAQQNTQNQSMYSKHSNTGYTGIYQHIHRNTFQVTVSGKHISEYTELEDAIEARLNARKEHFGRFGVRTT